MACRPLLACPLLPGAKDGSTLIFSHLRQENNVVINSHACEAQNGASIVAYRLV